MALHLVRHAQGLHNVSKAAESIHDPDLTRLGRKQCLELSKNFPHHDAVELLVSSPLRRTLYTTLLVFATSINQRGLRVIALPDAQETSSSPCDVGSSLEALKKEFDEEFEGVIDFGALDEGWNVKTGRYAIGHEAVRSRAKSVRQWLEARPEKEIVLVAHGGFIHFFTEDWNDWANAEWHSYRFLPDSDNASLVETEESRLHHGGILD